MRKGSHLSEEFKRRISLKLKNRVHSEEEKKKISLGLKLAYSQGRRTPGMLGTKHSNAWKENMSMIMRKKWADGEIIRDFGEKTREKIGLASLGRIPWNKGLTKDEDVRLKKVSEGRVGMEFSLEHRGRLAIAHAIALRTKKGGVGPYKGIMFRSEDELKVAKNLDVVGVNWRYESKYFILRNGLTYTPDFETEFGWIEVKGFYRSRAVMKMNLFVEAGNKLFIIDGRNINNPDLYGAIPWSVQ